MSALCVALPVLSDTWCVVLLLHVRIVNRYDGVPTAPSSGYSHFRPSIWCVLVCYKLPCCTLCSFCINSACIAASVSTVRALRQPRLQCCVSRHTWTPPMQLMLFASPSTPCCCTDRLMYCLLCWFYRYRDSSGNLTPSPRRACVLLDQNQLTEPQEACFISCNSVLTCSYGRCCCQFHALCHDSSH
jgi:hypothetical protein